MRNVDEVYRKYGFRYGGIIYLSNYKPALEKKREEIGDKFGNDLDAMKKTAPINRVDKDALSSLLIDYEYEHVFDLDEKIEEARDKASTTTHYNFYESKAYEDDYAILEDGRVIRVGSDNYGILLRYNIVGENKTDHVVAWIKSYKRWNGNDFVGHGPEVGTKVIYDDEEIANLLEKHYLLNKKYNTDES